MSSESFNNTTLATHPIEVRFWQLTWHIYLMKYVAPVILIVGVCGNSLTMAVMFTKQFRKSPSSLILGALALADTGLLVTGLLRLWLAALNDRGTTVRETSDTACKIHAFFTYFFVHTSPSFLVILTMERVVSVYFPFRCREICSRRRVFLCIISVIIWFTLVELYIIFVFTLIEDKALGITLCGSKAKFQNITDTVWYWLDSSFGVLVPVLLIFAGNIMVVRKLVMSERRRRSISTTTEPRRSSLTLMLMAVSACFLLLNLPSCVYFIGHGQKLWKLETVEDQLNLQFAYDIVILLYYLNTAINFILYCMTGSKFRRAFLSLFHCLPNNEGRNALSNATNYATESSIQTEDSRIKDSPL